MHFFLLIWNINYFLFDCIVIYSVIVVVLCICICILEYINSLTLCLQTTMRCHMFQCKQKFDAISHIGSMRNSKLVLWYVVKIAAVRPVHVLICELCHVWRVSSVDRAHHSPRFSIEIKARKLVRNIASAEMGIEKWSLCKTATCQKIE